jgi:hypothetical protein
MRFIAPISGAACMVAATFLVGCGEENMSEGRSQLGRVVDAPVAGLKLSAGSMSDMTDENGLFYYAPGTNYTFSVGRLVLGHASSFDSNATITPGTLAASFPVAQRKQAMLGLTRFFMTIDNDANPNNGIRILSSMHDVAQGWTGIPSDFMLNLGSTDAARMLSDIRSVNNNASLNWATTAQATAHLESSMACAYAGTFFGTMPNGDRVAVVVNRSGNIEARQYSPETNQLYKYNSTYSFSNLEADTALNQVTIQDVDSSGAWLRYSQDIRYPDYIGAAVRKGVGSSFPEKDRPLGRIGGIGEARLSFVGHIQTPYPFGRDYAFIVNTYDQSRARGYIVNLQSGSIAELIGGISLGKLRVTTTLDGRAIELSGAIVGGVNLSWSAKLDEKFNDVNQAVGPISAEGCENRT